MTARFITTDPETGDGYFEDEDGTDFSNEGRSHVDEDYYDEDYSNEGRNYALPVGAPLDEDHSNEGRNHPAPSEGASSLSSFLKSLGLTNSQGDYDIKKILGLAGAGVGLVGAATAPTHSIKSMSDLKAGMPSNNIPANWTNDELAYGARPMQTGSALQRVYAADMQSPVTPGKTSRQYAEGGEIEVDFGAEMPGALTQAFSGGVAGADGGQSDLIDIKVSAGEYVMDADSVSALGDGNTEAGIAKLDELRRNLREQKRSAGVEDIPPPAQGPLSYTQGA